MAHFINCFLIFAALFCCILQFPWKLDQGQIFYPLRQLNDMWDLSLAFKGYVKDTMRQGALFSLCHKNDVEKAFQCTMKNIKAIVLEQIA